MSQPKKLNTHTHTQQQKKERKRKRRRSRGGRDGDEKRGRNNPIRWMERIKCDKERTKKFVFGIEYE